MKRLRLAAVVGLAVISLIVSAVACTETIEPLPTSVPDVAVVVQDDNAVSSDDVTTSSGDSTTGQKLFATTCSACHGPAGEGVQGLGKDMTQSEFIAGLSDEELITFIKEGRRVNDPLNTTGIDMPPNGGNPSLTDENLIDIVAFIRSIHVE